MNLFITRLASYFVSFLLFLLWLPIFLKSASGSTLSSVTRELGIENLYGIVSYLFLYQPPWEGSALHVSVNVFIVVAIVYLTTQVYKKASAEQRRYFMLLACYFFVPVLVLVILTHFKSLYLERYIAHFAIGAYVVSVLLVVCL